MDQTRFDALARALSHMTLPVASRRGILAALGGLAATTLASTPEIASKRRRKRVRQRVRNRQRKRNRKKAACPTGQLRCNGGCAGCCADTDCGGNACVDGRCADCPAGQRRCRGGCIAEEACCTDGECTGGRVCVEGACACRASERLCQGTCIPNDACCGTDCPPQPTCTPANCAGCCDGSTCRDGEGRNFCGRNGVACAQCRLNEQCDGETCVCPTDCCGDEDCTAVPGGVCKENGFCQYPCIETGASCNGVASCCDPAAGCVEDVCAICIGSGDPCTPDEGATPCCGSLECSQVSTDMGGSPIYECLS